MAIKKELAVTGKKGSQGQERKELATVGKWGPSNRDRKTRGKDEKESEETRREAEGFSMRTRRGPRNDRNERTLREGEREAPVATRREGPYKEEKGRSLPTLSSSLRRK
jgi:hypothetical protein